MYGQPTQLPSLQSGSPVFALARSRVLTWRQIVPVHRLPVVTKTPLLIALGVYLSGGTFSPRAVGITMLLSAALWTVLYTLNEATDLEAEKRLIVPRPIKITLYTLPFLICAAAGWHSAVQLVPFSLLTLGQILYCAPGLRLKRYWWGAILLSGTMNPVMRLQCGVLWGAHALHPLIYISFILLHLGSALRTRTLLRDRDRKRGYTAIPAGGEWVGMACTFFGYIGALGVCWVGRLPWIVTALVALAGGFGLYAWSGREKRLDRLRRGWMAFAVAALIALIALCVRGS
jgi:hypothetical protein